jgi:hypothetical protein
MPVGLNACAVHGKGMLLGYARVSTLDQNLTLQRDALADAGCEKIFIEQMSGAVADRPALREALDYARGGDTLIVWKLDRLARSMKQLIETVEKLRIQGVGFRSLTESIDTTTAQDVLVFHIVQRQIGEKSCHLIRRLPQLRLGRLGEVGDYRRIDQVGLSPFAERLGEGAHLRWIDHHHWQACASQARRDHRLKAAGSLDRHHLRR